MGAWDMSRPRLVLLLLMMLVAVTAACFGPRPLIDQQKTLAPAHPGDPYTVRLRLRNNGPGEGQVEIEVQLVAADGTTYRQSDKVDLEANERTVVTLHVAAPVGDYETRVTTRYPPR
jgi:acyl dehydratase